MENGRHEEEVRNETDGERNFYLVSGHRNSVHCVFAQAQQPKKVPRIGFLPAELVEERELTKDNTDQSLLGRIQGRKSDGKPSEIRSRGLLGVREAARRETRQKFTSLLHHVAAKLLRASFFELKKQAAPGLDGERWQEYAVDFERRIDDLHERIIAEHTEPSLPSGATSPSHRAGCARWELLPWRTRSFNRQRARYWNVSTNKTSGVQLRLSSWT